MSAGVVIGLYDGIAWIFKKIRFCNPRRTQGNK